MTTPKVPQKRLHKGIQEVQQKAAYSEAMDAPKKE